MQKYSFIIVLAIMSLFSCKSIPDGVKAVDNFDKNRYLGQWYEIARFDFRFERNLNNTTAEYSLKADGKIKVVNKGYHYIKKKWQSVEGKAKLVDKDNVAMLKVSFFGPFYAGYNVIKLDPDYQYALVAGQSKDYLWILSRQTSIPASIKDDYVNYAQSLGFDVSKLIWVEHNQ